MSAADVYVALIGAGNATAEQQDAAEQIGRILAERDATLVCGGLGGVMAAACRGAVQAGGVTVGILPGTDRSAANPWVTVAIPTGLGELRNGLIVRAADAVIAVGGEHGTLSEIALAFKTGVPVIGLDTWQIEGIDPAGTPEEAVSRAIAASGRTAT